MATRNDVIKTLTAMQAIMPGGDKISKPAAELMVADLDEYPPEKVLYALKRCRDELQWFPTVAAIKERIRALDGRPGVEEAWSLCPKDEYTAAYLNDEVMQAWSVANDVLQAGDSMISARMAFKEVYERVVRDARARGKSPSWWLSRATGANRDRENERAVQDAVDKGRLPAAEAKLMLPEAHTKKLRLQLPSGSEAEDGAEVDRFATIGDVIKHIGGPRHG